MMQIVDMVLYLITLVIVMPLSVWINNMLYTNISKEEHQDKGKVVQYIMKQFAQVQRVSWPLITSAVGLYYFCYNVLDLIPDKFARYISNTIRFVYDLNRDYVSFNSLIIATIRFSFIVLGRKAETFGIARLRKLFISCSIGIPIFNNFLYEATQPIEQVWITIFHDKATYSTPNMNTVANINMTLSYDSDIFVLATRYLPPQLRYALVVMEDIMMVILYSNFLEGLMYAYTIYVFRRNKNSNDIEDMLSKDALRCRKQKEIVGLQTNFLAWMVEFVTGLIMLLNFLLGIDLDNNLFRIFLPLDIILCSVVIPGCYVFRTEEFREKIFNIGWDNVLIGFCNHRERRVSPSQEIQIQQIPASKSAPKNDKSEPAEEEHQPQQICHSSGYQEPEDENWWMRIQLFDE